ncbi:DNase/tRNase domain of colicin-like bacteriocin [Lachnospiraceae bacterium XBD2001]|nr:DNase/tRNase domain of colicin-like bacteriocin [Lachnospiraceae bacterium XBD2001]
MVKPGDVSEGNNNQRIENDELPDEIGKSESDELPNEIGESESDELPNELESNESLVGDVANSKEKDANSDVGELSEEEKLQKIKDFEDGLIDFEEVKEILAEYYSNAVNSNRPWSWNETVPGGSSLTAGQKKKIIELAREKGLVPTARTYEKDGRTYADFSEYVVFETTLDIDDWNKTDSEQFDKCNQALNEAVENDSELAAQFTPEQLEQIKNGKTPTGYTWHHSEKDGTMQLVPFGIHNSTNHSGGRSEGNWADAPRH